MAFGKLCAAPIIYQLSLIYLFVYLLYLYCFVSTFCVFLYMLVKLDKFHFTCGRVRRCVKLKVA